MESAVIERQTGSTKLRETVAGLRQRILDGTWPINSRIPKEVELMELFGVGKSTVREAVRSLASVGMLEPIKGVGTFVRSLTPVSSMVSQFVGGYDFEQILGYRRALEIEAAQQAAMNRTEEQLEALRASYESDREGEACAPATPARGQMPGSFHHLIFEAAGNPLMASMFAGVMGAIRNAIFSGEVVYGSPHGLRHLDHGQILEAIARQDVAAAAHSMALHVDRDLVPDDGLGEELERTARRIRVLEEAGLAPAEAEADPETAQE